MTWVENTDEHGVTQRAITDLPLERRFKSPVLGTSETFGHRFDAPGAYPYFCSLHPKMTGTVVVR
jgi:plastocyanin